MATFVLLVCDEDLKDIFGTFFKFYIYERDFASWMMSIVKDENSNFGKEVQFKMAIERIIRDPVHSYFAFSEESGSNTCLTGGCGIVIKGKNTTNLKYHLREKHIKEYVDMMSKSVRRDNQIQQFFEFNGEMRKSICKTCGVLIKGKNLFSMKLHLHKHFKEKDELREVELIPLPGNSFMELQNSSPQEPSNSVVPKPVVAKSKIRKTCPGIDISSPLLKEPFKEGWRREIVYRAFVDPKKPTHCDVYYYTPEGKKLRSGRDILDYLSKVKSTFTLENFTLSKVLIGVGTQETMRKANPRSHRLSNSKTVKIAADREIKLQFGRYKLRRNASKRKTLKVREDKLQRKFKKDQALRDRQKKLQKNLHKLGVDMNATTLPLDLPLTAPIYLPLGTTLVFSNPSSIKIKYIATDNSCVTVEQDVSWLHNHLDSSTVTTADVSATRYGESNIDEQRKDDSMSASSSYPVVPSCSPLVTIQTALHGPVEKQRIDYPNLNQSIHSQSPPKTPSSFLEHLELIASGKPFYLHSANFSEDSMPPPVHFQEKIIPFASPVVLPPTKTPLVRVVRKQPDGPLLNPSALSTSKTQSSQHPTVAFQAYH